MYVSLQLHKMTYVRETKCSEESMKPGDCEMVVRFQLPFNVFIIMF